MSQSDCDRWGALSDSWAADEPLKDEEQQFLRKHPLGCPHCQREADFWLAFGDILEDGFPRSAIPARASRKASSVWKIGGLVGAAAALGLIASGVFWASSPSETEAVAQIAQNTAAPSVQLVLVAGDVQVAGAQASAGASLKSQDLVRSGEGRACFVDAREGFSCAEPETRLRILDLSQGRKVRLETGTVICKLAQKNEARGLSVETSQGVISSHDGLFAVQSTTDGEVEVRVLNGSVTVETNKGYQHQLKGPSMAVISAMVIPQEVDLSRFSKDRRAIAVADLWTRDAMAPLDVTTGAKQAQVTLDGVMLGMTPVSMMVSRGKHDLAVNGSGLTPVTKEVRVLGAERTVEEIELSESLGATTTDNAEALEDPPRSDQTVPSATEMLNRARGARSAGRYQEAARWYERLVAGYPSRSEATIALLSLAELQLSTLGNASAALGSFDAYLRRGGTLTQEAEYGKIRALRSLGREPAAKAAAERFILRYPRSPQAESLKKLSKGAISDK